MVIPKEWFTADEAAEYLGMSKRTIYQCSKEGRLKTYILSRERPRRFRKEDLVSVPNPLADQQQGPTVEGTE